MRGPSPGVKPNANQPKYWSGCILGKVGFGAEITQGVAGLSSGDSTQPGVAANTQFGDLTQSDFLEIAPS
jgi:hypothetical protein